MSYWIVLLFVQGEYFNTWWELFSQSQIKSENTVRVELSLETSRSSSNFRAREKVLEHILSRNTCPGESWHLTYQYLTPRTKTLNVTEYENDASVLKFPNHAFNICSRDTVAHEFRQERKWYHITLRQGKKNSTRPPSGPSKKPESKSQLAPLPGRVKIPVSKPQLGSLRAV